jgi:hypothetical protein
VRFTTISVDDENFCGIATDGTAYCWSSNAPLMPPAQVATAFHFSSITIDAPVRCGLTLEGPEVCWGNNSLGNLGIGTIGNTWVALPTPVVGQRVVP